MTGESELDSWVDTVLAPYLIEQLGSHPRFKGEPVMLVSMRGDDVQARVDGLTEHVRERLTGRLLTAPGIHLPWRPSRDLPRHHRQVLDSNCRSGEQVQYYVGIEALGGDDRTLRLSVRALDLGDGQWVGGFGLNWQGRMTREEARSLAQDSVDESLRGLRLLPFDGGQPDLAAAYLANNLACLLRQQGVDDGMILVDHGDPGNSTSGRVFALLGNYLARFPGIRLTPNREKADLVLRGEAHRIDSNLLQLWAVLSDTRQQSSLPGVDTLVYVRNTDAHRPAAVGSIARGSPMRDTPVEKERMAGTGQPPVISWFRVIAPRKPELCGSAAPWAGGRQLMNERSTVKGGQCYALEYKAVGAVKLFFLNHTQSGRVWRIDSDACAQWPGRTGGTGRSYLMRGEPLPGSEALYAIAVAQPEVARQLESLIDQLPVRCSGVTVAREGGNPPDDWLSRLDALLAQHASALDWKGVNIRHAR
jgi:hypothetical protein